MVFHQLRFPSQFTSGLCRFIFLHLLMVWFQNRRAKWRKTEKTAICNQQYHQLNAALATDNSIGVVQEGDMSIACQDFNSGNLTCLGSINVNSATYLGMDWSSTTTTSAAASTSDLCFGFARPEVSPDLNCLSTTNYADQDGTCKCLDSDEPNIGVPCDESSKIHITKTNIQ